MKSIQSSRVRQQGFIQGAILFGLLLLSVVVGAFALANRSSPTTANAEVDKTNSNLIIKVGGDLVLAAQRFAQDYGADQVNFSTSGEQPSVFTMNFASPVTIPAAAFESGSSANFAYVELAVAGIGTSADERVLRLNGLSETVCRSINRILHRTGLDVAPPVSIDDASNNGRREGCVSFDDRFMYYTVVFSN